MTYEDSIQRRAPCGGWANYSPIRMGCGSVISTLSQSVPAYDPDTSSSMFDGTVKVFDSQPERPDALPSCGGGGGTCDTGANPSCGPFISSNNPACSIGDVVVSVGDYPWHSCFKPKLDASGSQSYFDLSPGCQQQFGWKGVTARKYHHGILSPLSPDVGGIDGFTLDPTIFYCSDCKWTDVRPTADQRHYLTLNAHIRYDMVADDGDFIFAECNRNCSVGKTTGFPTYTGNDSSGSSLADFPDYNPFVEMANARSYLGSYSINKTTLWRLFCEANAPWVAEGFPTGFISASQTETIGCDNATITRETKTDDGTGTGGQTTETNVLSVNLGAGTYSNISTGIINPSPPPPETGIHEKHTVTITATSIVIVDYKKGGCGVGTDKTETTTATITFSDPYDFSEVQSYAKDTLLNVWNMGSDYYPYRHDNLYTVCPMVTTDEIGPTNPDFNTDPNYTASADPMPTGGIIGGPLDFSTHYLRGVYSRRHKNYAHCFNGVNEVWYVSSYGGTTDGQLPMSATQWTNLQEASVMRPLPNSSYTSQTYTVQKMAYALPPKPSFNYARFSIGCGQDRYVYDESTVSCLSSFDSASKSVTLTETQTYAGGDVVYLCGTDFDGGYSVSSGAGTSYTLGALVFSASAYIDPYAGFVSCGSGRIGKLRFPTAPPVCGRHFITGVTTNTSSAMTMSIDAQSFLRDGDSVQCVSSSFDGTYVIKKVLDRSTIALPFSGSPSYTPSGYIRSTNSAAWQWDDNGSKGDYSTIEYQWNYRDLGEYNRILATHGSATGPDGLLCDVGSGNACGGYDLPYAEPRAAQAARGMPQEVSTVTCAQHCIGNSACGVATIVVSPNSNTESFANCTRHDIGGITGDSIYGSEWAMQVKFWDGDYLYQQPHPLCGNDRNTGLPNEIGPWQEDDATCHATVEVHDDGSTTYWYPKRNYYESRCSAPSGSPAPPSGVYLGCLNTTQLNDSTPGNVCPPPSVIGFDAPPVYELQIYAAEQECVCADGDFGAVYAANGTYLCVEIGI